MPQEPAPKSIEIEVKPIVGATLNPFTGQQQIYNWNAGWTEMTVTMPPMDQVTAAPWIAFLVASQGLANVFVISNATWAALIPAGVNIGGYWRMNANSQKWSVNDGLVVGMSFVIREAI